MVNSADPDQLAEKPTDLDLYCLQMQGISGFSRTRVNNTLYFLILRLRSSTVPYLHVSSNVGRNKKFLNIWTSLFHYLFNAQNCTMSTKKRPWSGSTLFAQTYLSEYLGK